jgi:FecR protein
VSNVNTPSGSGDRRLNVSRLLVLGGVLAVVLAAGYLLLREPPQTAPLPEGEAPKDMAAVFESLQGNVKTRGVGGLEWRTAETRNPLRKSDLVRTYPSSSAEIKFFDETRVTVRPDSLITIEETSRDPNASSKVAWKVSSGEINYETAQKGAGSAEAVTPTFRLALESNSAGTMRVGESGLAAVAQFAGGANIETKTGEKIRLGANEGIRVDADGRAGAKQVLPSVPVPAVPGSSGLVSLPTDAPVVLAWSASAGATSYRVVIESKEGQSVKEVVVDREGWPDRGRGSGKIFRTGCLQGGPHRPRDRRGAVARSSTGHLGI